MSQNKYNYKFNVPELTPEQVAKHKDFDALLARFETSQTEQQQSSPLKVIKSPKSPKATRTNRATKAANANSTKSAVGVARMRTMRRNIYYIMGSAAAVLLVVAFFFMNNDPSMERQAFAKLNSQPFVYAPMEKLQKDYTTFKVDGNKGGVFEYESGSTVTIPANAFVDESGQPVNGEIELQYKEYVDYVDFFIGGIPFNYDSASASYQLISAGVIDVQAFQNGEPVQLLPEKSLEIALQASITFDPKDSYNAYKIDAPARNWQFHSSVFVEPILSEDLQLQINSAQANQENSALIDIEQQTAALQAKKDQMLANIEANLPMPEKPIQPLAADPNNNVTNFDFDEDALKDEHIAEWHNKYRSLIWEVSKDQQAAFDKATTLEWDAIQWRKVDDYNYQVTMIDEATPSNNVQLRLRPVLAGQDYQNAVNDYEEKLKLYENQLAERQQAIQNQLAATLSDLETQLTALQAERNTIVLAQANQKRSLYEEFIKEPILNQPVVTHFTINSLGVWNVARPTLPSKHIIEAKFQSEDQKPLNLLDAYLVNQHDNTLVHFVTTGNEALKMAFDQQDANTSTQHIMWVVDNDGHLKVARKDAFSQIKTTTDFNTFKFEDVAQKINSETDLRNVLAF